MSRLAFAFALQSLTGYSNSQEITEYLHLFLLCHGDYFYLGATGLGTVKITAAIALPLTVGASPRCLLRSKGDSEG